MLRPGRIRLLFLLACVALFSGPLGHGQSPATQRTPAASLDAKKARKAYQLGQQAEATADWQAAFDHYAEAAALAPNRGEYLMRREMARFRLVQQHVDRAERAALAGRLEEAQSELRAALKLDPGYSVARERLEQFEPRLRVEPARIEEYDVGLVRLKPQSGTRSFHYRGDTRGAYEEVAQQFGVTVTFDEGVRAREIRFRVADVDFNTALRLLGQQTGTFWRALDEHSFLVAENNPQKRREYAPSVVRTVLLPASATPERMTETLRLVREIAGITRTQLDTRTRTLTMRDSPEAIALAVELIEEAEQAIGEMMLEIEVLEVDRSAARRLGLTPPTSARIIIINPQDIDEARQSPEALLRVLLRIFGTPSGVTPGQVGGLVGGPSGLGSLVPPLIAFGGGRTVLLATLPGAAAEFAETLSVLRGARRMLLRAQDGQPATFFIGERFPIALAVLSPSIVSPALTQGMFQRTDVAAGDGPVSLAAADFSGDGRADLAVANETSNNITLLTNNGDGTFAAGQVLDLGAGAAPTAVVAAELGGDSQPDLAVAITNPASENVSIFLGSIAGFGPGPSQVLSLPPGSVPRSLAAADFNGDTRLDLAVANSGTATVSIFLRDMTGAFNPTPAQVLTLTPGSSPRSIVAANFNGDAALDLVVANEGADTLSIFLGNVVAGAADGTFTFSGDLTTDDGPVAVTTGDFDNDGFLEVAVANAAADSVLIFPGNGNGTFDASGRLDTDDEPSSVTAADFNADGNLDLAVTNRGADTVAVFLGTGTGGFGFRLDFSVGDGPSSAVAEDFNSDGRRDLAAANRESDNVSVILNTTTFSGAAVSQAIQPFPGFQYEDLGLKVRATPRLHPEKEVTLQLQIEIRSRSGQTINGIPVISNRTVEQTVRLREDETTLLTGIIQRQESLGISGWPGLGRAPGVGHLAGRRDKQQRESELLIVITPRRIRLAPRVDRSIYAGREAGGSPSGTQPPP